MKYNVDIVNIVDYYIERAFGRSNMRKTGWEDEEWK